MCMKIGVIAIVLMLGVIFLCDTVFSSFPLMNPDFFKISIR